VGESASSGASSSVEAGLKRCVSMVGRGDRRAPLAPGVAPSTATPPLIVRRGVDWLAAARRPKPLAVDWLLPAVTWRMLVPLLEPDWLADVLGGVANGLMVGGALISAERGCSLSGERARRSKGDAGSALLGRLIHFLTGAKDEPGE